jgi:hypothetical protein
VRSAVVALVFAGMCCATAAASVAPPSNLPVARLGDLRGFGPAKMTHFSTSSAVEWAEGENSTPAEAAKESEELSEHGFQLAAEAFFRGRQEGHGRRREAVSDSYLFATVKDAREELSIQVSAALASYEKRGLEKGTVRAIPGSVTLGAFVAGRRGATGNVFFSVGRCVFVIGDAVHDARARGVAATPPVAAADAVRRRAGPVCS